MPNSGFQFLLILGRVPNKSLDFANFSELANMTRVDLTSPVAAAATSQVKLCLYDEEERHIWIHLIEAQLQRQESTHKT
jgi:hypothetical protein